MDRAWAFYRRSTENQELSIEDQRRESRAFAAAQGWTIVREFEPARGFASGPTIDRDPVFLEMLNLADQPGHGIQRLVVYDVSRFGRLPAKRKIYYQEHFAMRGIKVVYVKGNFRDDGTIGDDITQMVKHSEAHEYSLKLSEVTLRGSKSHAALGHSVGGSPAYGYDRLLVDAGGKPVRVLLNGERKDIKTMHVIWQPSPERAPVVREIFEMYAGGMGLWRVVQELNRRKIPAPRGKLWCKGVVAHIIRNRVYLGERTYNRTSCKALRRGESGPTKNPREDWVLKSGAHEPLVSKPLFDQVQSRLKMQKFGTGRTYGTPYLLSSIGRCICGSNICGVWRHTRHGKKTRGYVCGAYSRIGPPACKNYFVVADELEAYALKAIRDQFTAPEWKKTVRKVMQRLIGKSGGGIEVAVVRRQFRDVSRQIENLTLAMAEHGYSQAIGESLKALEARRTGLQDALAEAEAREHAAEDRQGLADRILAFAGEFDQLFEACMTAEEKKALLRKFIYGMSLDVDANRQPNATYHVYNLPGIPAALDDDAGSRKVKEVAGAGIGLDLKWPPPSILPWITSRNYSLKIPHVGRVWRRS